MDSKLRRFFFPSFTRKFVVRAWVVAFVSYIVFGRLCVPFRIDGISMEPTYHDGGFNFCWKLRYLFSSPRREDVVTVRFAGDGVMLLKRVVATEGDRVEFRSGKLFVNGIRMEESYVRLPCDWNLPVRIVHKRCVYVIGDNRSMPMDNHLFGNAPLERITGGPLW
jgi:signal peptidase I